MSQSVTGTGARTRYGDWKANLEARLKCASGRENLVPDDLTCLGQASSYSVDSSYS